MLLAQSASAQETAETRARETFDRGVMELQAERFDAALPDFRESYRLRALPVVLYNLGLTYRGLHRNAEAFEAFTQYLAHPEAGADPTLIAAVTQEAERLRAGTAHIVLQLEPGDAQLVIDGRARESVDATVALDPGPHVVETRAAGFHDARADITVVAGEHRTMTLRAERYGASALQASLRLAASNAAQEDRARRTQYALIGSGAALSVVGIGVAALLQAAGNATRDDYLARCVIGTESPPSGGCLALQASRRDQLSAYEAGTYVGLGLAVVGLGLATAGTITLVRMGGAVTPTADVRLSFTPGSVAMVARW